MALQTIKSETKANIVILAIAFFWGFTTVLMQVSGNYMNTPTYIFLRFAVAALALLPFTRGVLSECLRNKSTLFHGLVVGAMIYLEVVGNVVGMEHTTVSNCSFIAQLSIIIVPLIEVLSGREKSRAYIWAGIGVTLVGLVFLTELFSLKLNVGDIIVFGVALLSSINILYVAWRAKKGDDLRLLGVVQIYGAAAAATIGMLFNEDHSVIVTPYSVLIVLLTGVVGTSVCKVGVTLAQKYVAPQQVSFDLSLMPVFGVVGAMLIPGVSGTTERLYWNDFVGCALILAGFFIILYNKYKRAKPPEGGDEYQDDHAGSPA